jgi:hypothetical protein
MREVSVGGAVAAGFRLIAREPLAFLAWVALYGIVGIAPQMLGWAASLNTLSAVQAGAVAPAALAEAMGPMQRFQPVTVLTGCLSAMFLYGAGFRAMLYPDERRYFYLRLGARELWMALTSIVLLVIYVLALFAMIIPFMIVIFGASAAGGGAGAAIGLLVGVPLVVVAMGVVLWGLSRLSVALPMSFAQRTFRIPEAWKMTKGHAGRIFLVMLALVALVLLAELLVVALFAGVFSLFMPLAELGKLFTENPAKLFTTISPAAWVLVAIVWSLFGTAVGTVFAGALAQIYSDLAGPSHADVFS